MKKLSLLILTIFLVVSAKAQITITDNNVFLLEDEITYYKLFDVDETFPVGSAGENVIWDFSNQSEAGTTEFFEYLDPTGKPHVNEMPSIDLAERLNGNDNGFFYYDNNGGTEWNRSGTYINDGGTIMWWHYEISATPTPLQLTEYPFTYNTEFTIDPFGGHGGYDMSGSQDELVIPNTGTYHFECDGYGKLILPHKIYENALRVHVTESFTIDLYMTGTPVVSMDVDDDAYYWYVEGVKGPVMSYVASTTTTGKDVTYNAKWYREELTEITADFTVNSQTGNTDDIFEFTNLSEPLNQGSTFLWEFSPSTVTFEGGTDATSAHPKVRFDEAGLYSVTLTTTNSNFTPDFATVTKTDYMDIEAAPELVVDFSADNVNPNASDPVNFTATVNDESGTTYHWAVSPGVNGTHWGYTNFTDENDKNPQITFYQGGIYSIQLVATNSNYSNSPVTVTKMNYINVGGVTAYEITFTVTDGTNPINGAEVNVSGLGVQYTNSSGIAVYNNVVNNTYSYTVSATNFNDESGSVTVSGANANEIVTMTSNLSVKDIYTGINIFPNPTNGIINISSDEPIIVSLFDISGKQIFNSGSSNKTFEFNLSNNSRGLYFITIIKNNKVFTEKIILK